MALKNNARYAFGLHYMRFMALNDDLTKPAPDNIIGGAGPFDFSGYTPITTIPLKVKLGAADEVAVTMDLTAAVDDAAVTVDEVVTALTAAFTTADVDLTASKVAETGRLKIVADDPLVTDLQVYGDGAKTLMIGQGHGVQYLVSDTMQSFSNTPVRKEGERITTTDAQGFDTEVITDGYYKGFTGSIVDTAEDWAILALLEGLHLDATTGALSSPTFATVRPYVAIEAFYAKYRKGQSYEGEMVGYRKVDAPMCKGMGGEKTHERGWSNETYTVEGKTWVDESGVEHSAWTKTELTVPQFNALDIEHV